MGTWGTALYSDDFAADLRNEFRDLIGEGLSANDAVERLKTEYASSLTDQDEEPVFWLAIADTAWKLGRPHADATREALRVIEIGSDLRRFEEPKDQKKRRIVLQKLADQLLSPAPSAKRVAKPFKANNNWTPGEVIAYRLASDRWTAFRVIGHHTDKGGRSAVCEPLDWIGQDLPVSKSLRRIKLRKSLGARQISQFLVGERRKDADTARFVQTGIHSKPRQTPAGYTVFVFPHFDRQLLDIFGLE